MQLQNAFMVHIFSYNVLSHYNDITTQSLPPDVTTLNSARGADFKQFDLRLSRYFTISKNKRVELIAEGFNVTNAKNPGGFVGSRASASFGKPTSYAGDFQRGEQRLFQLGARFEF